jgi:hypothetical protein
VYPGVAERPLDVGDVEDRRHAVRHDAAQARIEVGVREGTSVDQPGRDHREADAARGERGELALEPGEVA